ncbi:unnamed protein product [Lathyrus oleraceus]
MVMTHSLPPLFFFMMLLVQAMAGGIDRTGMMPVQLSMVMRPVAEPCRVLVVMVISSNKDMVLQLQH